MPAKLWLSKHSEMHEKHKNIDKRLFGEVYYKLRQVRFYKLRQVRYYKLRQVLLQIATVETLLANFVFFSGEAMAPPSPVKMLSP